MKAVILAGGKGTRLRPFTEALPKPMLPIGVKPILEIIISYLKIYGFNKIILAISYLKEHIMHYFEDGKKFGVEIYYSVDDKPPLGTAGAVKKAANYLDETFLVVLGDILIDIDYTDLLRYHKKMNAVGTMVIVENTLKIPYGILELDISNNNIIKSIKEKPEITFPVYPGVVVLEPKALDYIKNGEVLGMPELFLRLLHEKEKVVGYHHKGNWVDVGQDIDQYLKTNRDIITGKLKFRDNLLSEIFSKKFEIK